MDIVFLDPETERAVNNMFQKIGDCDYDETFLISMKHRIFHLHNFNTDILGSFIRKYTLIFSFFHYLQLICYYSGYAQLLRIQQFYRMRLTSLCLYYVPLFCVPSYCAPLHLKRNHNYMPFSQVYKGNMNKLSHYLSLSISTLSLSYL